MACYNPMLMQVADLTKEPMSPHLFKSYRDNGWKINHDTLKAYRIVAPESRSTLLESIREYRNQSLMEVPCGGCLGCRLDYSKDWANRCSLEAMQYEHNYFITLTYDDEHLVLGSLGNPTIVKKHVTSFLNSLRKKFERDGHIGVRYFGCQEYGDRFMRNHAHIILFNCPIPDLTIDFPQPDGTFIRKKEKMTGKYYMYSDYIQKIWKHGYVVIADANWNTEAYVSRYVMKKQKGKNSKIYEKELGIVPPYIFMSTHPAIGKNYLVKNYDKLLDEPYLILPRQFKDPLISGLPRTFKRFIKVQSPDYFEKMEDVAKRKAELKMDLMIGNHTLINDVRSTQERKAISIGQAYVRDFD